MSNPESKEHADKVANLQKIFENMKNRENKDLLIGTYPDRMNVEKREKDVYLIRPEGVRYAIEFEGTAKQVADDLLRQGEKGLTDLHRLLNKSKNKDKDMGDR